jgi:hypothetical protein
MTAIGVLLLMSIILDSVVRAHSDSEVSYAAKDVDVYLLTFRTY